MLQKMKAYTLAELMVVVIIFGVLAAAAVPAFKKNMSRSKERSIAENLAVIKNAMGTYIRRNNLQTAPTLDSLQLINSTLKVNLIDPGASYACYSSGQSALGFECSAYPANENWSLRYASDSNTLLCNGSSCPTCTNSPNGNPCDSLVAN